MGDHRRWINYRNIVAPVLDSCIPSNVVPPDDVPLADHLHPPVRQVDRGLHFPGLAISPLFLQLSPPGRPLLAPLLVIELPLLLFTPNQSKTQSDNPHGDYNTHASTVTRSHSWSLLLFLTHRLLGRRFPARCTTRETGARERGRSEMRGCNALGSSCLRARKVSRYENQSPWYIELWRSLRYGTCKITITYIYRGTHPPTTSQI